MQTEVTLWQIIIVLIIHQNNKSDQVSPFDNYWPHSAVLIGLIINYFIDRKSNLISQLANGQGNMVICIGLKLGYFVLYNLEKIETYKTGVSSMIHSAMPTVSPVANIVFAWNLFLFWKVGTNGRHLQKQWSLPAVTVGWPSGWKGLKYDKT